MEWGEFQVSTVRMTVWVEVYDGYITCAAPIIRKFIGQSMDNLCKWMKRHPGYRVVRLK